MLPYGFATLAELKARLGIGATDHDAILQEIMNGVSGAIEASAGRQLRRALRSVEYFTGGNYLIRTRMFPIAKIHSVRESDTRDFETAANYEELTEDATDGFMLDRDTVGREPGASGFIRRLGGKWLGDEDAPGMIRVEYTGGYKSEEEVALENAVVTLSGSDVLDYAIGAHVANETYNLRDSTTEEIRVGDMAESSPIAVAFFRFATLSILPVWNILSAVLTITTRLVDADNDTMECYVIGQDPLLRGSTSTLWNSFNDENNYLTVKFTSGDPAWVTKTVDLLSSTEAEDIQALFQETLKTAFMGLLIKNEPDAPNGHHELAATENTTSAYRPSLQIEHGLAFADPFTTPDDLRHAALIQAAHDWQTRRHPGMTAQSMRGVAIASGASYMKQPSHLLPEVQDIARRYRQYR